MGLPIGKQWTYFPLDVLGCYLNIAGVFAKIYAPSQLLIMEEIIFLGSAEPCCAIIEQLKILDNNTVKFLLWRLSAFQISNKFVAPIVSFHSFKGLASHCKATTFTFHFSFINA